MEREFVITIDSLRSLRGCPTHDGQTVVLTAEDPHSVCVVEVTQAELTEYIESLTALVEKEEGRNVRRSTRRQ